ncbi:GNAT family N-acetyltransferase [Paenibacillus antri]|uniref:GNAT family N-acetyltransferase n=1 Tax=Paenibacillus antri TaxID=2582848 RepID=A0A5R9GL97_9BACL|nr:GNAT family N-acetyltransferase [Paenibacillus antri]TLS52545.1 GNAT family N-acetyltransferase [Paenibacillus antri]
MEYHIRKAQGSVIIHQLDELLVQSKLEGFRFVQRLVDEFAEGRNRFDQPGESLYVCYADSRIVGICGVNRMPANDGIRVGRVRRFYVSPAYRRLGVGRKLMQALLADAAGTFDELQLRTDSIAADRFYRSLGFARVCDREEITHFIRIVK